MGKRAVMVFISWDFTVSWHPMPRASHIMPRNRGYCRTLRRALGPLTRAPPSAVPSAKQSLSSMRFSGTCNQPIVSIYCWIVHQEVHQCKGHWSVQLGSAQRTTHLSFVDLVLFLRTQGRSAAPLAFRIRPCVLPILSYEPKTFSTRIKLNSYESLPWASAPALAQVDVWLASSNHWCDCMS